ncbi:indigoidine synthase A family protein [Ceratobasidium sp. AG-Ba]|nr:indigoidine synthase A family protein [Ceratobasidium sp. AG-Ba]
MYFLGKAVSRIARPIGAANARQLATSNAHGLLTIHPEVADALARGAPVVALESTVITHGLVYPHNLKTAISSEQIIRAGGAVPATIGLLEGRMHVGLERKQLEILADVESLKKAGKSPIKISRRDIAPAMSLGHYGGTTIAGTTVVAHLAGIKVFATGGLGGVHRGGETSMDVSADLTELGRTPIAVVASGAKSILDIGRTLEYLETQGVTVAAYDNDGHWPAFFSAQSGYKAPWAFNNPKDAAKAIYYADALGIQSGAIFGVPIPKEFEKVGLEIQAAVDQAVRESEENGIAKSGRDATPWLLNRVKDITKGLSLPSNIALLENNARIGAKIAVEYAKLKGSGTEKTGSHQPAFGLHKPAKTLKAPASRAKSPLVIIGAAAMDIIAQPHHDSPSAVHSTSPGSVRMSPGGVARNVAEAAHRVLESLSGGHEFESKRPLLISPVGQDAFGLVLGSETELIGMRADGLMNLSTPDQRTATCNMFLDVRGDLQMGVADMGIIGDAKLDVGRLLEKLESAAPSIVAFDGNPSSDTISNIIKKAKQLAAMTFFEPTSTAKCTRVIPVLKSLVENDEDPCITGAFPNIIELRSMWETARSEDLLDSSYWWSVVDTFGSDLHRVLAGQMATQLIPFIKHFVIKCGSKGVVLVAHVTSKEGAINWASEGSRPIDHQIVSRASDGSALIIRHFPAYALPASLATINVTGAGDSLVGALLAALAHKGDIFSTPTELSTAIDLGQRCAVETIQSPFAVAPSISLLK